MGGASKFGSYPAYGGGGRGANNGTGGGGGGGGAEYAEGWFSAATIGASQTITIGSGGNGAGEGDNGGAGLIIITEYQ